LSDILKRSGIQYIVPVIRIDATAYNDTNAQKEFSGFNYIGYKYRQLFGDKLTVDMTDKRILQKREMENYFSMFGRKQLPPEVWKNTTDLSHYYLRLGRITFDNMVVENAHEVVYTTDSTQEDYDITLYANANVGSTCDVIVFMIYAETFQFNGNELVKIN
jgi:hypothetical protein